MHILSAFANACLHVKIDKVATREAPSPLIAILLFMFSIKLFLSHFRPVLPSVEPGYLHKLLPTEVPEQSEHWTDVMKDLDRVIMPGITHWQSPNFHAYYPTQFSYPAIIGDLIASGFGTVNFSWVRIDCSLRLSVPTIH